MGHENVPSVDLEGGHALNLSPVRQRRGNRTSSPSPSPPRRHHSIVAPQVVQSTTSRTIRHASPHAAPAPSQPPVARTRIALPPSPPRSRSASPELRRDLLEESSGESDLSFGSSAGSDWGGVSTPGLTEGLGFGPIGMDSGVFGPDSGSKVSPSEDSRRPFQKFALPPTPISLYGSRLGNSTASYGFGDSTSGSRPAGSSDVQVLVPPELKAELKKRPSLMLTSPPAGEDEQGENTARFRRNPLGLAIDTVSPIEQPLPSPSGRSLKRAYPLDPSIASITSPTLDATSPTSPAFFPALSSPTFSASPSASPASIFSATFGSNKLELPVSSSPNLSASPPSPRLTLSGITDPLSNLTKSLSRKSSFNELDRIGRSKDGLPVASTSRSPSSSPSLMPSPTFASTSNGPASPLLQPPSPSVASGVGPAGFMANVLGRRRSYAKLAREQAEQSEKEAERKKEIEADRERKRRKKAEKTAPHIRAFSWAERWAPTDDKRHKKVAMLSKRWKGVMASLLVFGVLLFIIGRYGEVRLSGSVPIALSQKRGLRQWGAPPTPPPPIPRPLEQQVAAPTPEDPPRKVEHYIPDRRVEFADAHPRPPPPVHAAEPQRDTLILYRILGNDLPPRHSPGQTLRNLRFMLEHESDFSLLPHLGPHPVHHHEAFGSGNARNHQDHGGLKVDKYFVLNRIVDRDMELAIHQLLRSYSVPESRILKIPFDWREYQRKQFRWDGGVSDTVWGIGRGPTSDFDGFGEGNMLGVENMLGSIVGVAPISGQEVYVNPLDMIEDAEERRQKLEKIKKAQQVNRLKALDFMYHEKNLYAMNNNGGRNYALQHGRSLPHARWILPMDGNSFFTPAAMDSIIRTLSIAGEGPNAVRYAVFPMARLLSNEEVIANNSIRLVANSRDASHELAWHEADQHSRSAAAPDTPEEPQIGFRWDATEEYQPAMRYGRRSKLEMLWRLGAIPYARALDRRTLPWEYTDRAHITKDTWGSIPGVLAAPDRHHADIEAANHRRSHGFSDFHPWVDPDPQRGPMAFAKVGWVYRLFSGDRSQEEHSLEAIGRRSINRIKGIVAFLEQLDEEVSRGIEGCPGGNPKHHCGFTNDKLWSFDTFDVERLKQKFLLGRRDAVEKIDLFEASVLPTFKSVHQALSISPDLVATQDAQEAATNAALLALLGHLTGNSTYSIASSQLIVDRFIRQTPLFYKNGDQLAALNRHRQPSSASAQTADALLLGSTGPIDDTSIGYAFPLPPPLLRSTPSWADAGDSRKATTGTLPPLPFDTLGFDPTLLTDALRLLENPHGPLPRELSSLVSRKAVTPLLTAHLSALLFSPEAVAFNRNPASVEAGALYDSRVAALAAYLDEARLLGRVANRARLRLSPSLTDEGLVSPAEEVKNVHWRLLHGLGNVKLRPYSLLTDEQSMGRYHLMAHGEEDRRLAYLGI